MLSALSVSQSVSPSPSDLSSQPSHQEREGLMGRQTEAVAVAVGGRSTGQEGLSIGGVSQHRSIDNYSCIAVLGRGHFGKV